MGSLSNNDGDGYEEHHIKSGVLPLQTLSLLHQATFSPVGRRSGILGQGKFTIYTKLSSEGVWIVQHVLSICLIKLVWEILHLSGKFQGKLREFPKALKFPDFSLNFS